MKNYKYFLFLCLTATLFSCEKELDYNELDFKTQLVLNGLVYQDSIIHINVSATRSITDADSMLPFIDNAKVELYENNVFKEIFLHDSLGNYRSKCKTRANTAYSLVVSANEAETASAYFSFIDVLNFSIKNISFTIKDTILRIDEPVKADTHLYAVNLCFDMASIDNKSEENFYDLSSYGKVYSYMHSTSYTDEYNYEETLILSEEKSPYVSFRSNESAEKYNSGTCSHINGYEQNCYITDSYFNGTEVVFDLKTSYYSQSIDDSIAVVLFSYPYEYIWFHKTGARYISSGDNPFSQPINIYSNIKNGLGFVSAVSSCKQIIKPAM